MDSLRFDTDNLGIATDISEALKMMQLAGQPDTYPTRVGSNSAELNPLELNSQQSSWKSTPYVESDEQYLSPGHNGYTGVLNKSVDSRLRAGTALSSDQVGSTESGLPPVRPSTSRPMRPSPTSSHDVRHLEVPGIDTIKSEGTNAPVRPRTADSADIEKQANAVFEDFDGVHFVDAEGRRLSETHGDRLVLPEAALVPEDDQSSDEGMVDGNMVYYPAPVPMMLNMPQRLSKPPSAGSGENRRSQGIDAVSLTVKEQTSRLPQTHEGIEGPDRSPRRKTFDPRRSMGNLASLPPQLRASVFFEQGPTSHEVEIREQSAMATLESILDASAHAPVSAFTDHPFTGHLGPELYGGNTSRGHSKDYAGSDSVRRRSLGSLSALNSKHSSRHPGPKGIRSISTSTLPRIELSTSQGDPSESRTLEDMNNDKADFASNLSGVGKADGGETPTPELVVEAAREVSNERLHLTGSEHYVPPTTLMAELQLRKQQQRQRNMTAATAFPSGMMHSTLLELDSVAQVQKLSRKNKRIALAWEDPHSFNDVSDAEHDEEVPLAMLFPEIKGRALDEDRPLGLLEKRDLEESEPLSRRRERLRGGLHRPSMSRYTTATESAYHTEPMGGNGEGEVEHDADEAETLAQRARRLRAEFEGRPDRAAPRLSPTSANDRSSQLNSSNQPEEAEVEETLLQRKQRLQLARRSQSHGQSGKTLHQLGEEQFHDQSHNMANIPYQHLVAPNAQLPQSQSSPYLAVPNSQSEYNLQANNSLSRLGDHRTIATFPYSREFWLSNSGVPTSNMNIGMNNLNFSRSAHDLGFAHGNRAAAFNGSTAMSTPAGVGMGHAGTTSVFSGAGPSPASLGVQQREMIDRWRLSVLP